MPTSAPIFGEPATLDRIFAGRTNSPGDRDLESNLIVSPWTARLAYDVAAHGIHDFFSRTRALKCPPHPVEHPRRRPL